MDHSLFFQLEHDEKVSDKNHFQIEWEVDSDLMAAMKASNTGKCFESKMDNDSMWCIQCFPNGDNAASAGDVELYVQLCWLPPNISRIEVRYDLAVLPSYSRNESQEECVYALDEAISADTRIKEFDYDNDQSAKWSHGKLSFAAFQELDAVTFVVCTR